MWSPFHLAMRHHLHRVYHTRTRKAVRAATSARQWQHATLLFLRACRSFLCERDSYRPFSWLHALVRPLSQRCLSHLALCHHLHRVCHTRAWKAARAAKSARKLQRVTPLLVACSLLLYERDSYRPSSWLHALVRPLVLSLWRPSHLEMRHHLHRVYHTRTRKAVRAARSARRWSPCCHR